MTQEPTPNVFALGISLDSASTGQTGPRSPEIADAGEAPARSLLAIRPPERTTRAPAPDVLADVDALLAASGAVRVAVRRVALLRPTNGQVVRVHDGTPASIGRQPGASIVVLDSRISREHCAVRVDTDGVVVEDLGSTNGTWVRRGGQRILAQAGVPVLLADEDRLYCEDFEIALVSILEDRA